MMETKAEECEVELAVEKDRHIIVEANLKKVTLRHSIEVERITKECQ